MEILGLADETVSKEKPMKVADIKIGDRIKIVSQPIRYGEKDYYIHADTVRVFNKLIKRNRPVRISTIDEFGTWYKCRFKERGKWHWHSLAVTDSDKNWVKCP